MAAKLLYIALRIDITGDGASMYAMNNVLAFASQVPTDVLTLQGPRTAYGQELLSKLPCSIEEVQVEPIHPTRERIRLLQRGHNIFRESPALRRAVIKKLQQNDYAIVILELYSAYLLPAIRRLRPTINIVLNQHNYEYENHLEYIQFRIAHPLKRKLYRLANFRYRAVEHRVVREADGLIAISEYDQQLFNKIRNNDQQSYLLSPALPLKPVKDHYKQQCSHLLFIGMMDWYPNIQGVLHFVKDVFHPLIEQDPSYHFYIVGKNPVIEIQQLQSANIHITGAVEDIDVYIKQCDLMVVPVSLGGGVKIKVMEAIQKGIPLLVHQSSAQGYKGVADYFVVNDMAEFKRRIIAYPQEIANHISALAAARSALNDQMRNNKVTAARVLADFVPVKQTINTTRL
ncbi:glycosyltransferase [Olivibacter sp. 47]|uniref:glycosyltransferase n=1 Tax=Olivibacter sp. 47 TaxID=3056486 RepID=UPI0025A482B8|nr:glycosyltransferase [Olivibacter sp. 47]MDM8177192.1 glycosyltransferase [Olivibacter sp. 47]